MSRREFGSDGFCVEQLAFERQVDTISKQLYQSFSRLPDKQEFEARGIDVRRPHFLNGLTAFAMQVHVSFDVREEETGDMPPALLKILPDIVDRREDLRVTLVLQDLEIAERKGVADSVACMERTFPLGGPEENPGFALILASQDPDCDKPVVGIPSSPDRGIFAWTRQNAHPRNAFYAGLRGQKVPQQLMEGMLYGASWFMRIFEYRMYRMPEDPKIKQFPVSVARRTWQPTGQTSGERGRVLHFRETA